MWTVSRSWLPRTRIDASGRQAPSGRTPDGECQMCGRKDCEDGQSLLHGESGAIRPGRALGPARVDDEAGTCPASVIAHRSSSEERRTITVAQRRGASFFSWCAFFLVNLKTSARHKGLRTPWTPGDDLIHTLFAASVHKPARSKSIIFRKAKLADIFEALFAFWHSMRFS